MIGERRGNAPSLLLGEDPTFGQALSDADRVHSRNAASRGLGCNWATLARGAKRRVVSDLSPPFGSRPSCRRACE